MPTFKAIGMIPLFAKPKYTIEGKSAEAIRNDLYQACREGKIDWLRVILSIPDYDVNTIAEEEELQQGYVILLSHCFSSVSLLEKCSLIVLSSVSSLENCSLTRSWTDLFGSIFYFITDVIYLKILD